jgi:hypothetical protein
MDGKKKHIEYIKQQKTVSLNYRGMFFTSSEKLFLSKWWVWMNGLCSQRRLKSDYFIRF